MSKRTLTAISVSFGLTMCTAACGGSSGTSDTQQPSISQQSIASTNPAATSFVCPTADAVGNAINVTTSPAIANPTPTQQYGETLNDVPSRTPVPNSATDCEYVIDLGGADPFGTLDVQFIPDPDGTWYTQTAQYLVGIGHTSQPSPPLGKESIALVGGTDVPDDTQVLTYVGGYDLLVQDHTNTRTPSELQELAATVLASNPS